MLEAVGEVHAEQGGDRGDGQEHGGDHVEAMGRLEHVLGVARLLLGAAGDGVVEALLGVGVGQLEASLGVAGEVADGDEGAVVLGGVAGFLQGAVEVASGAQQGAGVVDQAKPVVGAGGLIAESIEAGGGLDEGLDVGAHGGDARRAAAAAVPGAVGGAPEEAGVAALGRVGVGELVQDHQHVAAVGHAALAAGVVAHALAKDLGHLPGVGDRARHGREYRAKARSARSPAGGPAA